MEKLPEITKAKQIGKNFTVVVGNDTMTLTGSAEALAPAKEAAKKYKEKRTKANYNSLVKAMKPETVKKEVEKDKKVAEVKTKIKQTKEAVKPKTSAKVKKAKVDLVKELESQMVDGDLTESEAESMRRLLAKSDAKKQAASTPTPTRRRGEY